ncbi:hypothetical protein [Paenibacillus brasilensis]|uniref:RNA polymerase-binding transcription factor DksA n=1 Tax=Paenibacillus brasilensis TaxID=128574 RepID=A0ABU0KRH7_9BACL|nr:hypothetical protein [Paenibacillus brasilensis]MDQ0491864.1 RNA polymerase-binding transcription factor DksA [Paenibacillus brasilensis]
MDKQKESRALRAQLRELYEDSIDAANFGLPDNEIHAEIIRLSSQLQQLEQSIGKNEEYEGLEAPKPSGYKISGKGIGICEHCGKEVFSAQKFPIQTEEGLFCNYYCRDRNRKIRKAQEKNRVGSTI